jgi:hypothetical protein
MKKGFGQHLQTGTFHHGFFIDIIKRGDHKYFSVRTIFAGVLLACHSGGPLKGGT